MQVPLEIAFHNIERSDWAEKEIRDRVAELDRVHGRVTSCQVRVDQRASLGEIAELTPGDDFGFLMTREGGLLYFHRNAVLSGDFDHLARGDEVYYVADSGDTGPTATKVRVKGRE